MKNILTYKPYYEAVKKILDGIPVPELDEIRKECNQKAHGSQSGNAIKYTLESIILTFAADAENKILLGEEPTKVYGKIPNIEPERLRNAGINALKYIVDDYFKAIQNI